MKKGGGRKENIGKTIRIKEGYQERVRGRGGSINEEVEARVGGNETIRRGKVLSGFGATCKYHLEEVHEFTVSLFELLLLKPVEMRRKPQRTTQGAVVQMMGQLVVTGEEREWNDTHEEQCREVKAAGNNKRQHH